MTTPQKTIQDSIDSIRKTLALSGLSQKEVDSTCVYLGAILEDKVINFVLDQIPSDRFESIKKMLDEGDDIDDIVKQMNLDEAEITRRIQQTLEEYAQNIEANLTGLKEKLKSTPPQQQ